MSRPLIKYFFLAGMSYPRSIVAQPQYGLLNTRLIINSITHFKEMFNWIFAHFLFHDILALE